MALTLGTVDTTRYITDAKRVLVEWLTYYLALDHAATFAALMAAVSSWLFSP